MRNASLALIATLCAQGAARGQATSFKASPAPWVTQVSPLFMPAPAAPKFRAGLARDTAAIRRTYWLEGGLIGGTLVGVLGSQLCKLGDHAPATCYVGVFFLTGGFIGFPAGALIGGQFPKHDSPSGEPPPN